MFTTEQLIKLALAEDLGSGDMTTLTTVPAGSTATATLTFKENAVVAGLEMMALVYRTLDASLKIDFLVCEGDPVDRGTDVARVTGCSASLLMGERVALNFFQHLSGIATLTRQYVDRIAEFHAAVVDTRKTTPGWRTLEKYAVQVGGGKNHRMGLFDGIMIKDNHIKAAGSITKAVQQARRLAPHTLRVEVEVENLEQLEEACRAGAEIILLDNMAVELMQQAVDSTRQSYPGVLLEASGGITLDTIAPVAATGVDFISVGALTHSARAIDISMNIVSCDHG